MKGTDMKNQIKGKGVSRRQFLGTSAAAAAVLSVGPLSYQCSGGAAKEAGSTFNGVAIGAITYSFRSLEPGVENVLKACIDSGVTSIELTQKQPSVSGAGVPLLKNMPGWQRCSGMPALTYIL